MAIREDLLQQFGELGVEPSEDVLDKCAEICVLDSIDIEEFVETWMAYSLSHLNGAEPTVETILRMQRKEFANRDEMKTPKQDSTPVTIYNTPLNNISFEESINSNNCVTPKGRTPRIGIGAPSNNGKALFSPASYSPDVGTPCSKYKERTTSRQVVLSHGSHVDNVNWSSVCDGWAPSQVELYVHHTDDRQQIINLKNRLMMESLPVKVDIINDHIDSLSKCILDQYVLEEPSHFRHLNSEIFITVGTIYSADSRLQQNSVMLQTSETFSHGSTIELNLQRLLQPNKTCSGLFPGQVVAIEGTNPIGDKILVQRVFSPRPLALPPTPCLQDQLQIVVAAGPFTQADNLLYEPLEDFVSYIKINEPHLAIIIGPIVDVNHSMVKDGSLAETYEEFYSKVLTGVMDQLACCQTQIVVVVSARDASQCPIYPTAPLIDKKLPNLMSVSDPSLITLNGLIIGVSATDILMHLSREEIALPSQCGGDRLGRLASHLLTQHNFYPLHPSPEDLPIDMTMWENLCNIPVTPHILILPSDLRYFVKNVGDCVVVNPERLAKGQAGGSFARLNVQSTSDRKMWSPTVNISGQILKI